MDILLNAWVLPGTQDDTLPPQENNNEAYLMFVEKEVSEVSYPCITMLSV